MQGPVEENLLIPTDLKMDAWIDPSFDPSKVVKEEIFGKRAFVLRNSLTKDECKYYRELMTSLPYEDVSNQGYQKKYRNNERLIAMSDSTAKVMLDRIIPFIEDQIVIDDSNVALHYPGTKGTWSPLRINSLIRICRYQPSGHFAPHYDGEYVVSSLERSFKTVMFYLNDDFEGGTTNFVNEDQKMFMDESVGRFRAEDHNILYKLKPEEGMVLVFDHRILHEGEVVVNGLKYIMRSELVYKCSSRTTTEEEEEVEKYIQLAQNEEAFGRVEKAIEYYKLAKKINPKLAAQWGV